MIFHKYVATDRQMNMYITCDFQERMFFQGLIINHCNTPYPLLPDIVTIKLNAQHEIEWTGMIGGTLSDQVLEQLVDDDGNVLLLTEQVGSVEWPTTVSFFEQDTVIADHDFSSVTKLDNSGNIIWRKDFHGQLSSHRMTFGKDGNYYLWGSSFSDIIVEGDTIFKPENPVFTSERFFCILTPDGVISELDFFDFPVFPYELEVNESGAYFVSGSIYDTTVLGQDTVIVPEDSYYGFIGKFDQQFQPIWYYVVPRVSGQQIGIFKMGLDGDNLVFASSSNKNIQIADTLLTIGYNLNEGFVGEFDANGNLLHIVMTETTKELVPSRLMLDNCNNIVISGYFTGWSYLGSDTLMSFSLEEPDGFIAKLQRTQPASINLGPDTLACDQYTLVAPEEYSYYIWNDSLTMQNWFTANETGTYTLACAGDDGCWRYDTVNVSIQPGFEIDLGPDTTIVENDTIVLSVPGQYQSYLWSNGSDTSSIQVIGSDYGVGSFPVWVDVTEESCTETDTVWVTVKSDFGIDEFNKNGIELFPNPFYDMLQVKVTDDFRELRIIDISGMTLLQENFINLKNLEIELDLRGLSAGVYILEVNTESRTMRTKIIKR